MPTGAGFAACGAVACCGVEENCWSGRLPTVCETGGMRRVHLRGHPNIRKRLLVHVAGCNLGLLMRHLIGVGTPRSLQGRPEALFRAVFGRLRDLWDVLRRSWALFMPTSSSMTSPRRDESVRSVM